MAEKDYPEYIYHYTKAENLFKILPKSQLKLSSLQNVNDPFEVLKTVEIEIHNNCPNLKESFDEYDEIEKNDFKVLCFSADSNDIKGHNRPSMWAHYAEEFKGVCLKIKTSNFLIENAHIKIFHPIKYNSPEEFETRIKLNKDSSPLNITKTIIYQKRKDWAIENEWRLCSLEGVEFCSIKESLESIIIGSNFDKSLLPALNLIKENLDIDLIQTEINRESFNIELKPILSKP